MGDSKRSVGTAGDGISLTVKTKESYMFAKSLLTLGLVAAMSLSMSGAFAQNSDHRGDHRQMHNQRGNFEHARHGRQEHRASHHRRSDHRSHR